MSSEDSALVKRCLKGDEKAFAELLEKYKSSVFGICLRMLRNHDDAEDLAQEVFIRVFNVLDRYNPSFPFSSWLYRITSNLCIDFIRREKAAVYSLDQPIESADGSMPRQIPSRTAEPDRKVEVREMMGALEQAMFSLPEHYRIILILRHQEHRSYEEISSDLSIPLGTVKARIHRARNMIKEFMQKTGLIEKADKAGGDRS